MSSRNREFLLYYDIERDVSSQVFNMPGRDDEGIARRIQGVTRRSHSCVAGWSSRVVVGQSGVDFPPRAVEPHQLASAIVDGCFYDNDTCYFVGGRGGWEMGE